MYIEGNKTLLVFLDKHRLLGGHTDTPGTDPPSAARQDPATADTYVFSSSRESARFSCSFKQETGRHKAFADHDTSPNLTITGAMVVGVIHGGSIALAEKGHRELSWVALTCHHPGLSPIITITLITVKSVTKNTFFDFGGLTTAQRFNFESLCTIKLPTL